jgi:hypothetical protein
VQHQDEVSRNTNSEGDVWASGSGKVHQTPNSFEIGYLCHEGNILSCGSTHILGEGEARFHWSRNRVAIKEFVAMEHIKDVLFLAELDGKL